MSFDVGDVVLVTFPFTDHSSAKRRPAVVVSQRTYNEARRDVILMPVSSRVRSPLGFGEVLIADWREAGLLKPSIVKPVVATFDQAIVAKTLGGLVDADRTVLSHALRALLG